MAEIDTLISELRQLTRTIGKSGSMGSGSELKGGFKLESEKQIKSKQTDMQDRIAKQIQDQLSKSSNAYVRASAKTVNTFAKLREVSEKNIDSELASIERIQKARAAGDITAKQAVADMRALGRSAMDVKRPIEDIRAEMEELIGTVGDLDEAMDKAAEQSNRTSTILKSLGAAAMAVGKEGFDVLTASMRTGVQATAGQIIQARMMGMSQVDLIETLGQYKQTINAAGMSNQEFTDRMQDGAWGLQMFTGDLKAGAKFVAESAQTFRMLGGTGHTLDGFVKDQGSVFEALHNNLGMTADQFNDMTSQLIQSQTVRTALFKLDKSRRASYFLEIQQVQKKLQMDGLSIQQSQRVIDAMEGIAGKGPKERMKEAAQMQAAMGAMGMGEEGARMAELMRGGMRGEGDKAEFAALSKLATARSSELMQGGIGSEMAMQAVLDRTDTAKYVGADGAFADTELQEGMAVDPNNKTVAENTTKLNDLIVTGHGFVQASFAALAEGPLTAIAGSLSTIVATMFGGALASTLFGSLTSAIMGSSGGGMGGGMLKATAATAVAAYAVSQAYQAVTTGESDIANNMTAGTRVGDAIGASIAHALAFLGNENAQTAISQVKQQESYEKALEEKANTRDKDEDSRQQQLIEARLTRLAIEKQTKDMKDGTSQQLQLTDAQVRQERYNARRAEIQAGSRPALQS